MPPNSQESYRNSLRSLGFTRISPNFPASHCGPSEDGRKGQGPPRPSSIWKIGAGATDAHWSQEAPGGKRREAPGGPRVQNVRRNLRASLAEMQSCLAQTQPNSCQGCPQARQASGGKVRVAASQHWQGASVLASLADTWWPTHAPSPPSSPQPAPARLREPLRPRAHSPCFPGHGGPWICPKSPGNREGRPTFRACFYRLLRQVNALILKHNFLFNASHKSSSTSIRVCLQKSWICSTCTSSTCLVLVYDDIFACYKLFQLAKEQN